MMTLRDLRARAGLTLQQAADKIREIEPSAPRTGVGLKHIEDRGTQRLPLLRAIAATYGATLDEVEAAAQSHALQKNITNSVISA